MAYDSDLLQTFFVVCSRSSPIHLKMPQNAAKRRKTPQNIADITNWQYVFVGPNIWGG